MLHVTLRLLFLLLADLALNQGLNTYTSNDTYWRSTDIFIPQPNSIFGSIVLHRALKMEFDFIYYGKTSDDAFENVLRVGYDGVYTCKGAGLRYPAMFMESGDLMTLRVSNGGTKCWNSDAIQIYITKHRPYHVTVEFNRTWQYITLTERDSQQRIVVADKEISPAIDEHLFDTPMSVWFAESIPNVLTHAPNMTLSNITIVTWNPITPEPTPQPSTSPTPSPTLMPTTSTVSPTAAPTGTPTNDPTPSPTYSPTFAPTEAPTTLSPTRTPTQTPSTTPSTHPTSLPTKTPTSSTTSISTTITTITTTSALIAPNLTTTSTATISPTKATVIAREPTRSPLNEGQVVDTTAETKTPTTRTVLDYADNDAPLLQPTENNVFLILLPVLGFGCILCLFLCYFWRKWNSVHKMAAAAATHSPKVQQMLAQSPRLMNKAASGADDQTDILMEKDEVTEVTDVEDGRSLFNKMYDKARSKVDDVKYTVYDSSRGGGLVLPSHHEESWSSSAAAEQMYVPHTLPSTTQQPPSELELPTMEHNRSSNGSQLFVADSRRRGIGSSIAERFAFNKSRKASVLESDSQDVDASPNAYDLSLQHQVTVAISDDNGLKVGHHIFEMDKLRNSRVPERASPNNPLLGNLPSLPPPPHDQSEEGSNDDEEEDEDEEVNETMIDELAEQEPSGKVEHGRVPSRAALPPPATESCELRTPDLQLYGKAESVVNSDDKLQRVDDGDGDSDEMYAKGNAKETCAEFPQYFHHRPRPPQHLFNELEGKEGDGDYKWIEWTLRSCDDADWPRYLQNFKDNKVSDNRLNQLTEKDWLHLIPKIGPRNEFKMLWLQQERQRGRSLHL